MQIADGFSGVGVVQTHVTGSVLSLHLPNLGNYYHLMAEFLPLFDRFVVF